MMFPEHADFARLAGEYAPLVWSIDYDEENGTRNYILDFNRRSNDRVEVWYGVHIELIDGIAVEMIEGITPREVTVTVTTDSRQGGAIGSFTLPVGRYPSPVSLDPEAIRRACGEIILADVRRRGLTLTRRDVGNPDDHKNPRLGSAD